MTSINDHNSRSGTPAYPDHPHPHPGAPAYSDEGLQTAVKRRLHQNGQRMTRLKQAVLEAFAAAEVLSVEQIGSRIDGLGDLSPLYRCLSGLEEAGVLTQVSVTDGPRRYALHEHFGRHHDYLLCTRCASLQEMPGCALRESAQQHASRSGFLIEDHQVLLRGICAACRQVEGEAAEA